MVILVTLVVSPTVFEILTSKASRKWLVFHTPPFFDAIVRGDPLEILNEICRTKLEGWGYRMLKITLS